MHPFLLKLYADGGYHGPVFQSTVRKILRQIDVETFKRSDLAKGFAISPKRWIVERTTCDSTAAAAWPKIGSAATEGLVLTPRAQKALSENIMIPDTRQSTVYNRQAVEHPHSAIIGGLEPIKSE